MSSLTWVEAEPFRCQGGMSLIRFSMLVHAINVYLNDNDPETPKEFNFQAELKAASHWDWLDDEKRCLVLGPHDDRRVKSAAKQTFDKWVEELNKERAKQPFKKPREDSRSLDDERVSGKRAGTCSFRSSSVNSRNFSFQGDATFCVTGFSIFRASASSLILSMSLTFIKQCFQLLVAVLWIKLVRDFAT